MPSKKFLGASKNIEWGTQRTKKGQVLAYTQNASRIAVNNKYFTNE